MKSARMSTVDLSEAVECSGALPKLPSSAKTSFSIPQIVQELGLGRSFEPRADEVILVSIDWATYNSHRPKVTELGVAVLDTRTTGGTGNLATWEATVAMVQYAHYRVKEYSSELKERRRKHCPDTYEFGESIWISSSDVRQVVERVLSDPMALAEVARLDVIMPERERAIVVVGNDLGGLERDLRRLGVSVEDFGNVVGTTDVQKMTECQSFDFERVLETLGLRSDNLANAGNTAALRLHALLKMAFQDFARSK